MATMMAADDKDNNVNGDGMTGDSATDDSATGDGAMTMTMAMSDNDNDDDDDDGNGATGMMVPSWRRRKGRIGGGCIFRVS